VILVRYNESEYRVSSDDNIEAIQRRERSVGKRQIAVLGIFARDADLYRILDARRWRQLDDEQRDDVLQYPEKHPALLEFVGQAGQAGFEPPCTHGREYHLWSRPPHLVRAEPDSWWDDEDTAVCSECALLRYDDPDEDGATTYTPEVYTAEEVLQAPKKKAMH